MKQRRQRRLLFSDFGYLTVELEPCRPGTLRAIEILKVAPLRQELEATCALIASQSGSPELGVALFDGNECFAVVVRDEGLCLDRQVIATCKPSSFASALLLDSLGLLY